MKQEAITAVHDERTPWLAWVLVVGLTLLAGCAGSVKMHYADVGRVVRARTGLDVEWPVSPSMEAAAWNDIAPMLDRPLTTDDAVKVALINNRTLRAALDEVGISRADLIQATLPANPEVFLRYRWQTTGNDLYNYELRPSQDFMEFVILPLRRRAAKRRLERTKAIVADAALNLAGQTRIAFYTLQGDLQARDQWRRVVESRAADADLARRKRMAGDLTERALLGQEAALSKARLDLASAELRVAADRERLNRLMGLSGAPADTWRVAGELPPLPEQEPPLKDLVVEAILHHMDLTAEREEGAALRQVLYLQQITRWVPIMRVGLDYERNNNQTRVIGPTLVFNVPIFDWGQARVARTRALLEQNRHRTEALEVNIRSEVREARERLLGARDAVLAYRNEIAPRAERLGSLARGDGDGSAGIGVPTESIDALRDYWIARARLDATVNGSTKAASEASAHDSP